MLQPGKTPQTMMYILSACNTHAALHRWQPATPGLVLAKHMLSSSKLLTQKLRAKSAFFCLIHLLLWGGSEGQHGTVLLWQLGRQVASVQGAPNGH